MKQILIYDKKNYFFRYTKKKIEKDIRFHKFAKNNENSASQLKKNNGIIFIVYQEEDIVAFIDLYLLQIPMVVCSENKDLITLYKNIPTITCIDISQNKSEIFKELALAIDLKLV